jgi:hypothetical protein
MASSSKTIEWTLTSGKKAAVAIELQTTKTVDADGYKIDVKCCEMHITGSVEGRGTVGYTITRKPVTVGGTTYPATIGKLCIPAASLAEIDAAIAEIEATPEWRAKVAAEERREAADKAYEEHREKMRKIMGY